MTSSQRGDRLNQFSVRSVVGVIVVVVASRGAVSAVLLLLLVDSTATVATLMDRHSRRFRCIASLFTAGHLRRLRHNLDLDFLLKT